MVVARWRCCLGAIFLVAFTAIDDTEDSHAWEDVEESSCFYMFAP